MSTALCNAARICSTYPRLTKLVMLVLEVFETNNGFTLWCQQLDVKTGSNVHHIE